MSEAMEQTSALATIEATDLVAVFTQPNGVEAIVSRLEADARSRAAKLDISTGAGRAEIASLARTKIAGAKTALLSTGKKLTEDWRKQTAAVNADCKVIETRLNALRDEVRAPLTTWENAEKDRVGGHEAALAEIRAMPGQIVPSETSSETIAGMVAHLKTNQPRDWQEFGARAEHEIAQTVAALQGAYDHAVKREEEVAELARLRAEEAERQRLAAIQAQKEREARIATEAAERARKEAEAKADRERLEAARKAEAEREAAEREKAQALAQAARERLAAELAARQEREAAERREREALEAAERAEAARIAAEQKAERDRIAAAERAEREKAAAIEAERRRQAEAAEQERQAEAKRAADLEHRRSFNNEAVEDLVAAGVSKTAAIEAIKAIALGKVRHTAIRY